MELLTDELKNEIPPLGSQRNEDDPMVVVKFFTPWSSWTWYVIEASVQRADMYASDAPLDTEDRPLTMYNPEHDDVEFFGYVVGHAAELGNFRLSELTEITGPFELKIERDVHFTPSRLSAITAKHS
jgi:DUF2958 family protein